MPERHCTMPDFSLENIRLFYSKVGKPNESGCQEWTGCRSPRGYGKHSFYRDRKRVHLRANRVAYFLRTGVDPGDFIIMHSCNNTACCNPDHLSMGTIRENMVHAFLSGKTTNLKGGSLSEDQVREIRKLRKEGWSGGRIRRERMPHVSLPTIHKCFSGRFYKGVPE